MIWTADYASVKPCYNGLTTRFFENYTLAKFIKYSLTLLQKYSSDFSYVFFQKEAYNETYRRYR